MVFGKDIDNLLVEFFTNNKFIVIGNFSSILIVFIIDSIIIPRLMARLFINIKDKDILKNNIIKLFCIWGVIELFYVGQEIFSSRIEPLLNNFLTDKIINNLFIKYELDNAEINTTLVFNKLLSLIATIQLLVNRVYIVLLPRLVSLLIVMCDFYRVNNNLGIYAFAIIAIHFIRMYNVIKEYIDKSFNSHKNLEKYIEEISDKFDNINIISSTSDGIKREIKKCNDLSKQNMNKKLELANNLIIKEHQGYLINRIICVFIVYYSYNLYKTEKINTEQISSILIGINTFLTHMDDTIIYFPEIHKNLKVLKDNNEFLSILFSYKVKDGKDVEIKDGIIKFHNVSFSYIKDNKKNNIIENMSLRIDNNQIVGLFGPSGSGKSTFVKLILDILQPQSGYITIDGHDIKTISNKSLKKYISYVSQNTSKLFNTTIYDNIIYCSPKDIHKDYVINLMNKYKLYKIFSNINRNIDESSNDNYLFFDYDVGKNGELLSGGQKQIIHIIRTILNNNSKIIILDEPTTALDIKTRNNIFRLLKDLSSNKTILIITHDEELLKKCDKSIIFK